MKREVKLPSHNLISITGPRRAGKSYFLFKKIKELGRENCLFMNFERPNLIGATPKDFRDMLIACQELYGKEPKYLMLDEIRAVKNWEVGVRELHDKGKYNILITGSSSKLLPKEIATQLRGRVVNVLLMPFSFREFLKAKNIEIDKFSAYTKKGIILKLLNKFLEKGGFPEPTLKPEIYDELMLSIKDGIFYRDIIERYGIRKTKTFEFLTRVLVSSFSSYYTYSKLQNILYSSGIKISKNTIIEFVRILEECFLLFSVEKFHFKVKEILKSPKKVYVVDQGLIKLFVPRASKDIGKLMENCVFCELKRISTNEIFYLEVNQSEVDFVIKEGLEIKQLIQATYASNKDEVDKREIKALMKAG
ncbi:MAG: ATP-binding protein [Candidatus Aenigmatarchaeota archaeon]